MEIEFGIVSEIDPVACTVRVKIPMRDDIVSPPMFVLQRATKDTKWYALPAVNEHVVFLRSKDGATGVVLGAIYSQRDETDSTLQSEEMTGVKFPDGSVVSFDSDTSTLIIDSRSAVEITADSEISAKVGTTEVSLSTSKVKVKTAGASLKTLLDDILDACIAETHTTPMGPTSPPINVASYVAAKATVALLLDA